ncbi:hypothetical protein FOCC_FOCC014219 [Frankliniella occidentalis]|nr:hypothetical protein FOCC_FOCC014219 [Frankliniella occidentalis]
MLAAMGSAVDDFMLHQDTDSDEYVPKGVHIWETELHDFVVLYVVKDSDGAGGSSRDPADKKMGRHLQPLNTITYTNGHSLDEVELEELQDSDELDASDSSASVSSALGSTINFCKSFLLGNWIQVFQKIRKPHITFEKLQSLYPFRSTTTTGQITDEKFIGQFFMIQKLGLHQLNC